MIKRSVEISRESCHLAVRDEQLLVRRRARSPGGGCQAEDALIGRIPFEDLGLLMVDERETTYTHTVLVKLAEYGGSLVVCGRNHLPCGMYLPLSTNTVLLERLEAQISASKPKRKRLWATLVAEKIRCQASNLSHAPEAQSRLLAMAPRVKSGDPENREGQAAQLYWPALFLGVRNVEQPFRRRPGDAAAPIPNHHLDYGYAVLRASLGRAIVSAGLLPALGVQHHHRSNAFCLADDLMEPLRPLVDARSRRLAAESRLSLDQATKAEILSLLKETVRLGDSTGPLDAVLPRYVASFVRSLENDQVHLEIPVPLSKTARQGDAPVCTDLDEWS